jgi:hypothetical protein
MKHLINTFDINDSFFDHILCFGHKPRNSDAGHGGMIVNERSEGSFGVFPKGSASFLSLMKKRYVVPIHLRGEW